MHKKRGSVRPFGKLKQLVEQTGLAAGKGERGFAVQNTDLVLPYVIITLCTGGNLHGSYDMQEMQQEKNDLCIDV